jgi:hypothetical protein
VCLGCGRKGQWIKKPWSRERALRFTMPFGKFKRKAVSELLRTETGTDYLRWVAENLDAGNTKTAAMVALGRLDPEKVT